MTGLIDPGTGSALAAFAGERPRLRTLAYRLLGSVAEAEDTLQDAWLRWSAVAPGSVASPPAFLTTLVTRLALDRLRSARVARERYYGLWLPEPDVSSWSEDAGAGDGEAADGSVPMAMLLLLERLAPEQRAVFVLREAMDLDYAEIAAILGKSTEACRQIMRRARARLAEPAAARADAEAGRRLADAFAAASLRRDYAAIVALLADDAQWLSDGGGVVLTAVNPLFGSDRIARFLLGVQRKRGASFRFTPVRVNGGPGFLTRLGDRFQGVWALDIGGGRIRRIYQIANPYKLGHVTRWASDGPVNGPISGPVNG